MTTIRPTIDPKVSAYGGTAMASDPEALERHGQPRFDPEVRAHLAPNHSTPIGQFR